VGLHVKTFEWWTDAESYRVVIETMGEQVGSHASPGETAFMLAVCPSAVKLERLTGRDAPAKPSRELTTALNFAQKYPDGIMGLDPRGATREAGAALLKKSVEICAREVADWK
jgi:creatinine amidohydrolase